MKDKRTLAAIVAVLCILFMLSRRRASPSEAVNLPVAKRVAAKAVAPPAPTPAPKVNMPKSLEPGTVALARAEDQIALQRSGYVVKRNGESLVELRIEARAACHTGDLDVIKAALGDRDGQMLVTIEPMSGFRRSAIAHPLSYSALLKGTVLQFPVKPGDVELYGLFICSDSRRQNKCQGKPVANMKQPDPKAARAGDQIFYFQPIILEKNRFLLFEGTDRATASLSPYLNARGKAQGDAVTESRRLNEALDSIPANSTPRKDGNGSTLHVSLPYLEMTMCAKGRVKIQ